MDSSLFSYCLARRDTEAPSHASTEDTYRSPCGCVYTTEDTFLVELCEDHAPYAGRAFGAGDVLARIESEVNAFNAP